MHIIKQSKYVATYYMEAVKVIFSLVLRIKAFKPSGHANSLPDYCMTNKTNTVLFENTNKCFAGIGPRFIMVLTVDGYECTSHVSYTFKLSTANRVCVLVSP